MNPREIYNQLKEEDRKLLDKQIKLGLVGTAQEARDLAKKCADNYGNLWRNGLLEEAEDLRTWSFFWSVQYKEATEKLEFFAMSS